MESIDKAKADIWEPDDIVEELKGTEPELLRYMNQMPKELWGRHFEKLEKIRRDHELEGEDVVAELRINHILGVLQARERAIVEHGSHEAFFQNKFSMSEEGADSFGDEMRELLITQGNVLGAGQTARVKSVSIEGYHQKVAVKFLLTPTPQTLSVQGEHDMTVEAERMTEIENAESRLGAGDRIRVPHPLFHYKRGKLQCFGMDQISGVTLEQIFSADGKHMPLRDSVISALRERYAQAQEKERLFQEVEVFMRAVHEVCLHGDIKAANLMADETGMIYLIDFGQSRSIRSMSEETSEQFQNVQQLELGQVQECLRALFKRAT